MDGDRGGKNDGTGRSIPGQCIIDHLNPVVHDAGDRNCRLSGKPGKRIDHGQGVAGNVDVIRVVFGHGRQGIMKHLGPMRRSRIVPVPLVLFRPGIEVHQLNTVITDIIGKSCGHTCTHAEPPKSRIGYKQGNLFFIFHFESALSATPGPAPGPRPGFVPSYPAQHG